MFAPPWRYCITQRVTVMFQGVVATWFFASASSWVQRCVPRGSPGLQAKLHSHFSLPSFGPFSPPGVRPYALLTCLHRNMEKESCSILEPLRFCCLVGQGQSCLCNRVFPIMCLSAGMWDALIYRGVQWAGWPGPCPPAG